MLREEMHDGPTEVSGRAGLAGETQYMKEMKILEKVE